MLPTENNDHNINTNRLPALDVLRALAITLVYIWHYRQNGCGGWLDTIGQFGWIGVDLFFVLSGYLIGGQLMASVQKKWKIDFQQFYIKRFFRIIPSYVFVLIMYYSFDWFNETRGMAPLWRYLTFTQNFGLNFTRYGAFSHAWSLCIEEQFYFTLPLVLSLIVWFKARKVAPYLIFLIFIGGFVCRYFSWQHYIAPLVEGKWHEPYVAYFEMVYYPTYNRLDGLLIGVSIAAIMRYRQAIWERITRYGNVFLVIGLLLLIGAYFVSAKLFPFRAVMWGFPMVDIGCGCLVVAALSSGSFLHKLRIPGATSLALASYTIYLTHKQINHLVYVLFSNLGLERDSFVLFILSVLASILAGSLLHVAIEKPFLKLRDKVLRREFH